MFIPYNPNQNFFANGSFAINMRSFTSITLDVKSAAKWTLDRWMAYLTGSNTSTIESSTDVPTNGWSKNSALITFVTGTTDIYFGQRIPADLARTLNNKTITVSFMVKNAGTAFAPVLNINTPTATDDYTAVNSVTTATFTSAPGAASAFSKITATAFISATADTQYGLEILLKIPTGSLINAETFKVSQAMCNLGPIAQDFNLAGGTDQGEIIICGTPNDTVTYLGFDKMIDVSSNFLTIQGLSSGFRIQDTTNTTRFTIANDGTTTINATSGLFLPVGTTAQQPSGSNGALRYNSDNSVLESYYGAAWNNIASETYAKNAAIRYAIILG